MLSLSHFYELPRNIFLRVPRWRTDGYMQMYSIDKILEILIFRKQNKLAKLLADSEYDLTESSSYGSQWNSILTTVDIYSSIKNYDILVTLSDEEKDEIISAFHVIYPVKANAIEINYVEFFVHPDKPIFEKDEQFIQQNEAETKFWTENYFRLFISHSSKIKSDANSLSNALDKFAICGFVAHDSIEPTKEWQLVIEDALITCDSIVALLNEEFHKSRWTDQEIGISYGLRKTIIPVRLGVDPYGFMGKYQGIQGLNKSMEDIASEIFHLLLNKENTSEAMSRAIAHKFINSSSFLGAKANVGLLESITYMDKSLLSALKKSISENDQISKSFGVPYRLENIVNKWKDKVL